METDGADENPATGQRKLFPFMLTSGRMWSSEESGELAPVSPSSEVSDPSDDHIRPLVDMQGNNFLCPVAGFSSAPSVSISLPLPSLTGEPSGDCPPCFLFPEFTLGGVDIGECV